MVLGGSLHWIFHEAHFTISRTWGFLEHTEAIASDTRLPRPPRNPTHVDVLSFPSSETAKNATPHLSEIPSPAELNIDLSSSAICPARVAKSTGSPGWSVLDSDVGWTRFAGSYSTAYVKPVYSSTTSGKSSVSCPLKPSDSAPLC